MERAWTTCGMSITRAVVLTAIVAGLTRHAVPRAFSATAQRVRPVPPLNTNGESTRAAARLAAFDLDDAVQLAGAVHASQRQREIILLTSDRDGVEAACYLRRQLRSLGLLHQLLLTDSRATCASAPHFVCGFSTAFDDGLIRRYGLRFAGTTWVLWLRKWLVMERLVLQGMNVLALDSDCLLLASPYPILHAAPMRNFSLVIAPEATRVNLGFVYVRGEMAAPGGGTRALLRELTSRVRLFIEGRDRNGRQLFDEGGERNGRELCVLRSPRRHVPSLQGLWDQGLWTDALATITSGEQVYAYTWLHSDAGGSRGVVGSMHAAGTDACWKGHLHYPPKNLTRRAISHSHRVTWQNEELLGSTEPRHRQPVAFVYGSASHRMRDWGLLRRKEGLRAERPALFMPPAGHPVLRSAEWVTNEALLWRALLPSDHHTSRGASTANSTALPVSVTTAEPVERVLATPSWLYCADPKFSLHAGWASGPAPPCAVLHLVQVAAHFGRFDAKKRDRAFAARALGYWPLHPPERTRTPAVSTDNRLPLKQHAAPLSTPPTPPPTPPAAPPLRRVVLHAPRLWDAAVDEPTVHGILNALALLAVFAAVANAAPMLPAVRCDSRWLHRHPRAFRSISDPYVLQLQALSRSCPRPASRLERASSAVQSPLECHLSLGGERCTPPTVWPAWHEARERCEVGVGPQPMRIIRLTSSDWNGSVDELRAHSALADPTASQLEVHWDSDLHVAGHSRAAPWALRVARLQLTEVEAMRLDALQRACPGYFGWDRRRWHGERAQDGASRRVAVSAARPTRENS